MDLDRRLLPLTHPGGAISRSELELVIEGTYGIHPFESHGNSVRATYGKSLDQLVQAQTSFAALAQRVLS